MGCHCAEKQLDFDLLQPVLDRYANVEGSLIPILQKAQELYGYLPVSLLNHIACRTGVKPAKVMGVVSFYTQFRTRPAGKNLILLCQGTACHVNGSSGIEEAIAGHLGVAEGETTPDGLFTYNNVACIGCCSLSPVMMIDGKTFGNLTHEGAVDILKKIAEEPPCE